MPATPARIGFVQEEFRRVVSTTAQAKTRHGNLARESADPIETWFDNVADAQTVADERQALLSVERARYSVTIAGLDDVLALDLTGPVPIATLVDSELSINGKTLISEVTLDFQNQGAVLTVWG